MNFYFADLYPIDDCIGEMKSKYFQLNIAVPLTIEEKTKLGKFDLIRMQHVFEHFSYEQADIVLSNCYQLLNQNGKWKLAKLLNTTGVGSLRQKITRKRNQ